MCGGCGGGNRAQNVRKQVIKPDAAPAKKQPVLRHIPRAAARPSKVEAKRQYVVPRQTCPKCGYPAMTVNIANRERYQCSNSNCRTVIR